MNCDAIKPQLADYARGACDEASQQAVERHLLGCEACAERVRQEAALHARLLQDFAIPAPSEGFERRVLSAATGGSRSGVRVTYWGAGVAAAVLLALGMGLGSMLDASSQGGVEPTAQTASVETIRPERRTVRLAFDAARALADVQLTLQLPPNVEVEHWPGQHRLSWRISLDKGENVLNLPLNVLFPGNGELVARLDAGDQQKSFRVPLVFPGDSDEGRAPGS